MEEASAGRALIAFPAEVVARLCTCAVDDARSAAVAVVVGSAAIRSVAPLVEHLFKPTVPDPSEFPHSGIA